MAATAPDIRVYGIRHHGPGSARSLMRALKDFSPECLLVEGPSDATSQLTWLTHADMKAPIALLGYDLDNPRRSITYPMADFSPEWNALRYGLNENIPTRFMDLPVAAFLAERDIVAAPADSAPPDAETTSEEDGQTSTLDDDAPGSEDAASLDDFYSDPLQELATLAGFPDAESWWEFLVEAREDEQDIFQGILEAMSALRADRDRENVNGRRSAVFEAMREASMRQHIRTAVKEGHTRIAVVCGAWHAPALQWATMPTAKHDNDLLKGLPKARVACTWVPWTYSRLSMFSGYGAGVLSPGWYHHIWRSRTHVTVRWLSKLARELRAQGYPASSAQTIDTIRTADALAAMRDLPLPGIHELRDAALTVYGAGDEAPVFAAFHKLMIGERLGAVPADTPALPIQRNLAEEQKRLRLAPKAEQVTLELDLRRDTDLGRSVLLHRLRILEIPWGIPSHVAGKGTFKEAWVLQWRPELSIQLVVANALGSTVESAAEAQLLSDTGKSSSLADLTQSLKLALLAKLDAAAATLLQQIQNAAALSRDVLGMMEALSPLVNVVRYGDVRATSQDMANQIIQGLVARILVGLPLACASLANEAAEQMGKAIRNLHDDMMRLQQSELMDGWRETVLKLLNSSGLHGLVAGLCARKAMELEWKSTEEVITQMRLALSGARDSEQAAFWLDGFLGQSGLPLIHDDTMWRVCDEWITGLSPEMFLELLPMMRRTFGRFSPAERRQLSERANRGTRAAHGTRVTTSLWPYGGSNPGLADRSVEALLALMGLSAPAVAGET